LIDIAQQRLHSIAFEHLTQYIAEASRIYHSKNKAAMRAIDKKFLDLHPEDIHLEDSLKREAMDIIRELQMMAHIKQQGLRVLKDFMEHLTVVMLPTDGIPVERKDANFDGNDAFWITNGISLLKGTQARAQKLYASLQNQIEDINSVKASAEDTSEAVNL
jgi:hypothetical protein